MKTRTQNRRLLQAQVNEDAMEATLSPDPIFEPTNGTSTTITRRPFKPNTPFDSSMALTILVLLTALFFMGFFSLYIRRFAEEESAEVRRRRHPSPPLRARSNQKGLDPATVKALPLVSYGGPTKHRIIEGCTICLSEFEEGEIVKLIPHCRHVFHPTCIDTWLASHVSCPLCRSTQFFKKVDDEVCLDVMLEKNGNGVSELGGRSTAVESDTCREVEGSGGGVRRSCSCSNLEGRVVLQRSTSF